MQKFSQIVEKSRTKDNWKFVILATFEGFEPCQLKGSIEVNKDTPEGEVGEMIDQKMDAFDNLLDFKMLAMDKEK